MTPSAIAVFASGGGRSLENLEREIRAGTLDARIGLVLCDRPGAGVLERCERLDIPHLLLDWKEIGDAEEFARQAFEAAEQAQCELVALCGFLRLLRVPDAWSGRVINIHPSLLPAFTGLHTHQRAIDAGCRFAGCTVHEVTAELDVGPILDQAVVPVLPGDTADALAARVLTQEHLIYPRAVLAHLLANR